MTKITACAAMLAILCVPVHATTTHYKGTLEIEKMSGDACRLLHNTSIPVSLILTDGAPGSVSGYLASDSLDVGTLSGPSYASLQVTYAYHDNPAPGGQLSLERKKDGHLTGTLTDRVIPSRTDCFFERATLDVRQTPSLPLSVADYESVFRAALLLDESLALHATADFEAALALSRKALASVAALPAPHADLTKFRRAVYLNLFLLKRFDEALLALDSLPPPHDARIGDLVTQDKIQILAAAGSQSFAAADLSRSIDYFERARLLAPDQPEIQALLGAALVLAEAPDRGVPLLQTSLKRLSDSRLVELARNVLVQYWMLQAITAMKAEDTDTAIGHFEKAYDTAPGIKTAFPLFASHLKKRNFIAAATLLMEAEQHPHDSQALGEMKMLYHLEKGKELLEQREPEAARQELEQAVRFGPENPLAIIAYAKVVHRSGDYRKALDILATAERLPLPPDSLTMIAAEKERLGTMSVMLDRLAPHKEGQSD